VTRLRDDVVVALLPASAGLLAAHALAYALVGTAGIGVDHGYLAQAPLVLTLLAALTAAGLLRRAAGRGGRGRPSPAVALLPPLAFALQEHLERAVPTRAWPTQLVTERIFLVGLALQLPFGLLAWLLARSLLAGADAVAQRLRALPPQALPARQAPAALTPLTLRSQAALRRAAARGPPRAAAPAT
jgi:hypothetical protein